MEIINRGKQKQFLYSALGFTDGKLTTHLQIVHVVNSGKDTLEREREKKKDKERDIYISVTPCTYDYTSTSNSVSFASCGLQRATPNTCNVTTSLFQI